MAAWTENEAGPWCKHCTCPGPADQVCDEDHGWPTVVKLLPDGQAVLMCFGHTAGAGLVLPLPAERPADWAAMSMRDVAVMLGYLPRAEESP
jgi:hypothetical protein